MTRKEVVFQFFRKSIVPVAGAALLVCIFKSACMKDGAVDYLWLWILCGLPMCFWFVPGGNSMGGGVALFALNFVIGGIIGGVVLVWRMIVAVWYVPLAIYHLIIGHN